MLINPINEHVLKIENEAEIQDNPEKYIKDNIFSGHHLIGGAHKAINSNFELIGTRGLREISKEVGVSVERLKTVWSYKK
jgi:hypothetical protein